MKRSTFFIAVVIGFLAGALAREHAFAAGTRAGTAITNTATLNYRDLGGTAFPAVTATITVTVAQQAGVAITPPSAGQTVGDSLWVNYAFVVQNTGNGKDKCDLSSASANGWASEMYLDPDNNGFLDAAEQLAGTVSATDSLDADTSAHYVARVFVPKGTADGTTDDLTVTATSQFNNAVSDSGVYTTTVQRALLTFLKSQDVSNPAPAQTIMYTLAYDNTGSGPATNVTLNDVLSTNVTLVGGSITGGGSYNSGNRTITWSFSRIGGGTSGSVSFQVTVNSLVPAGTGITNQGQYTYLDSTSGLSKDTTSNTTNATVALATALSATILPSAQSQDVGLSVLYHLTVTNNGNAVDSANLTYTSTAGFVWAFYIDINGNGLVDGADSVISVSNLGPLSIGGSMAINAVYAIPHAAPDGTIDSSAYTFTSLTNGATNQTVSGITTVRAPVMGLAKSVVVVGGGPAVPGATLRYTLSYANTGSGASSQTVVTDAIPVNTTYVLNSVVLNSVSKTDASDLDEVTVSGGTITIDLGSVAGSSSGTITFDVTIQ